MHPNDGTEKNTNINNKSQLPVKGEKFFLGIIKILLISKYHEDDVSDLK